MVVHIVGETWAEGVRGNDAVEEICVHEGRNDGGLEKTTQ